MTLESLSDNPPNACYCHSEQSEESSSIQVLTPSKFFARLRRTQNDVVGQSLYPFMVM